MTIFLSSTAEAERTGSHASSCRRMEKKGPGKRVTSEEKGKEKACLKTERGKELLTALQGFGRNKLFSS